MTQLHRLPTDALRVEPWANGGGSTTVLATGPDGSAWQWRLSLAQIDQDSDFSTLADTRRQFVPLDAPVSLHFAHDKVTPLLRLQRASFDGVDAPRAVLADGPTRAFNLMLRGQAEGEVIARPLNGAMVMSGSTSARWFMHVLAGQATLKTGDEQLPLAQGESAWIEPVGGQSWRIDGGGEIVLVRLNH
ncbi:MULTISPECIES: HutD/Ves family protein [Dyella]|uniref:HutD family protein n=2 Tax=Dyella TaxID=231454 RepID=A0A4R0YST0_9GAMM|nr:MULTISPECIES: HutD family protein [Dyella]TBR40025.1 HutD family protein [Dyella terrae]TCI12393.1 HutD family protein [Dyella soli]